MNIRIIFICAFFALPGFSVGRICNIAAQYRCKNGKLGAILERGRTIDVAKIAIRQRARQICHHKVDYIRFAHRSDNC